jgi:hypothetical protein
MLLLVDMDFFLKLQRHHCSTISESYLDHFCVEWGEGPGVGGEREWEGECVLLG